jgi:hypothetical protein
MNQTNRPARPAAAIYAVLIWMYGLVAYWQVNLGQANPTAGIRPALLVLAIACLVWVGNRLWLRTWQRAAVLTAWWGVLFSSYGHIYMRIENWAPGGIMLGRHRYMVIIWALLAGLGAYFIHRQKRDLNGLTRILNLVSAALLAMPLIQGGLYFVNQHSAASSGTGPTAAASPALTAPGYLPDIYFIVLDAYGRQDLLERTYAYDNSEFIDFLRGEGFYVADCSHSNYNHTWFSVATTLNMDYLENLAENGDMPRPAEIIKHSRVRSLLGSLGYRMVAFETGYDFIDISDADVYYQSDQSGRLGSLLTAPVNAFELMYLRTTLATAILELNHISEDQIELAVKKDKMEYTYAQLAEVPQLQGPKLVYAHINTTHPPFPYALSAEERKADEQSSPGVVDLGAQTRRYHESIIISNQKMESLIRTLLAESKTPPIIILEGDHGPFLSNTRNHIFENLSAFYFPDGNYASLYPEISPVNSFRVVLNQFFGASYDRLPDVSYYSDTRDTWTFDEIPNTCGQ